MKIIVNADDLGRNDVVNNKIYSLLEERKITSVSVLANYKYLEKIKQNIKNYPWCSFGIHLYLTEFQPITDNIALEPLIDDGNTFYKNKKIIRKLKLNKEIRKAIYDELSSQVELLRSFGIPVMHIDSHHHVHLIPKLIPIIKLLQKKYSINKLRIKNNIYNQDNEKHLYLKLLNARIINSLIKHYKYNAVTTDKFTDIRTFMDAINKNSKKMDKYKIELSVHPGHENYGYENDLLPAIKRLEESKEIELISYSDIT